MIIYYPPFGLTKVTKEQAVSNKSQKTELNLSKKIPARLMYCIFANLERCLPVHVCRAT